MSIEGQTIVVTGASSGIGAATAELLATQGATVVLAARRGRELDATVAEIIRRGGHALACVVDVALFDDVQRLVETTVERFGHIDAYVSNAGVATTASLADGRLEDWDAMIDVNLRGVLYGIKAALPVFSTQQRGHFVTVTSTSAAKWVPGQGVYAATKAGTRALCEILRQEAGPQIRSTMVCPGATVTQFVKDAPTRETLAEISMPADAVAHAIAYALATPDEVNVGEIVLRSAKQP